MNTPILLAHLTAAPHLHPQESVGLTILALTAITMMVVVRLVINKKNQ